MSGIEAANTVRKTDSSVEIIFLSTSNNFACESYSVNAFCYLVKPITKNAVESLMQRYFEKYEKPSKALSVLYKTKPEIKLEIAYDSIMYIDVINRKVRLHLKDKTLEIQNTFSQCASILTEDSRFSNCCKGFIVNFDYVNTISGNDFLMQNGDYVPIKKRENQQVKKQYLTYELKDIIQQKEIADLYKNGYALVFRLAVNDYHRYVFFDDGELISSEFIKGELHTIRPVSEKYKVYARNSRVVNVMDSKSFGIITQVEIGALLVGKIVNHNTHMFSRLEEKGYFEYGGSTIVMFFPPNIMIDEDILRQSQAGYETQVFIGDKIGQRKE